MSKVKLIPGLMALLAMAKDRKTKIISADANRKIDPVTKMAKRMHPEELKLIVTKVSDNTKTARTYRLEPENKTLPIFQAGQYISIKLKIGKSLLSRAYTISSAPYEAQGDGGYYEITVRYKENGFASCFIWDTWKEGTPVSATGPHGEFYVSPLRDTNEIVALAGGAGITPFISMIKQFAQEESTLSLTLLYGCRESSDILFEKEIDDIIKKHPDRFKRINTFENCKEPDLRKGFIDAEFIRTHVEIPGDKTYFICGPTVMYKFLQEEFTKVGKLEHKQMRYEVSGVPNDVAAYPGFNPALKDKAFTATVIIDSIEHNIPALAVEPLLVAVERAGLILDSRCRSGECGICRSKLCEGEVFILPDNDGRREADHDLGYIHPCSTYPLSDVTIIIPPGRASQT